MSENESKASPNIDCRNTPGIESSVKQPRSAGDTDDETKRQPDRQP